MYDVTAGPNSSCLIPQAFRTRIAPRAGELGAASAPFLRNIRGHLRPSKRAISCRSVQVSAGQCRIEIAPLLLGEVKIKLDQISSAWLLPAQP
jgi:hypothetical protein